MDLVDGKYYSAGCPFLVFNHLNLQHKDRLHCVAARVCVVGVHECLCTVGVRE